MSAPTVLHYLGPEGSFSHEAAVIAARELLSGSPARLQPQDDVSAVMAGVQLGGDLGVIAWESTVEGYVTPNLDALIDANDAAGFARVGVNVSFDAFALADHGKLTEIRAHPYGLAQCRRFIRERGLTPVPVASNAAACRDLKPGQAALGPRICGRLYHLTTLAGGVQDYAAARTDFLLLARRGRIAESRSVQWVRNARMRRGDGFESIVVFIPLSTGPGVLADLLDVLRDAGLNMTSFISRPIKGREGTYSFIATVDAAPWQSCFRGAIEQVLRRGDWVKTLAVYPRRKGSHPPVGTWMLPRGGAMQGTNEVAGWRGASRQAPIRREELLW